MNKTNEKKIDVLEITKMAAVIAIVLLLGLTPIGYIPVGSLQITTVHVVVIVLTLLLGIKQGLVAGLFFGISSIISALMTPGLFSPIFLNPLVSVVPRIILPLVAYAIFVMIHKILKRRMTKKLALTISSIAAAAVATLVHTILVLTMIWFFRGLSPELADEVLSVTIVGLLGVNMPLEILFATAGAGVIVPTLYPWLNKKTTLNETTEQ